MKIIYNIFCGKVCAFIIILTLFCGCIDDNYNCSRPTGTLLRFTYTLNTRYTDLFDEQVNSLALFFYDEQGNHILTKDISIEDLDEENRLYLELLPNNYRVIVWGNLNEAYFGWRDPRYISNFRLDLLCGDNGEVTNSFGTLFHGATLVNVTEDVTEEHSIDLVKNTNTIHVIMEGEESGTRNSAHFASITGCNGSYDIDNNPVAESTPLQYKANYLTLTSATQADFTIMRLFSDDDLTLSLGWNGMNGDISIKSLAAELMKHPEINTNDDLDRWDEYTLTYKKDTHGVITLIKINDWDVISNPGGI